MADQLCGQFYARLPDIVPSDCTRTALRTIYDACFLKFYNSQYGAANGVRPDGSPENPSLEVWTKFWLAAFLVQMEMKDEAFQLTEAVVAANLRQWAALHSEAITAAGTFRASHYLRAMAVWAIRRFKQL